jgi:hypothetical protein
VVSADLAAAALGCPALARARKLAEWVGPGRELTSTGVLRPAVAAEACRALGIQLPGGRLRSALDVDELMRAWMTAIDAEFVVVDGRRARVMDSAAPTDPETALNAWVRAAARLAGVPDDPCAGCLTVLHELYASEGRLGMEELAAAVEAVTDPDTPDSEPCPECGDVHDMPGLLSIGGLTDDDELGEHDGREHAEGTVAGLADFGAAVVEDNMVRLTPLGAVLTAAVFEGCAPPPDADAGTLVSVISELPPPVARTIARPWLEARSADTAVKELLAFAESASGERRIAALAFGSELGSGAAEAWRECAKRPGFGAYARQWLAGQGEPIAQDPADEAWLIVDALTIMLDAVPAALPPFLLAAALQQQLGGDVAEALSILGSSGHPAAASVVARLTGQPDPASSSGGAIAGKSARRRRGGRTSAGARSGSVYQLKITLRGVSKPPVWRRVAVPADITLDVLHEVIIAAVGWHGGHLHVFSTGWEEYGTPHPDLDHSDEAGVWLPELLSEPGDKLRYIYDFGDDWQHDILLEDILQEVPGSTYPYCLAGKGKRPPEDCGGVWGYADLKDIMADPDDEQHQEMLDWLCLASADSFDPKAFSIDEVNARLARLAASPVSLTVVR